jgi:hypothetical protein
LHLSTEFELAFVYMWILLLINSYVRFTFQCLDSGVDIVSTLRDERLVFRLRQAQMSVHDRTQNGAGDHGLVIIGHPVFVHWREGALV